MLKIVRRELSTISESESVPTGAAVASLPAALSIPMTVGAGTTAEGLVLPLLCHKVFSAGRAPPQPALTGILKEKPEPEEGIRMEGAASLWFYRHAL